MCFICRKWSNIYITSGNKVKTKTRNILDDWKAFLDTMGIIVPIWNINFSLIHISSNEMAKVDLNAFLSESEFRNLSLLHHFGGDSALVPQIVNVRNWSKQRFDKDCDQFAWGETREVFSNFHKIQLFLTLSS